MRNEEKTTPQPTPKPQPVTPKPQPVTPKPQPATPKPSREGQQSYPNNVPEIKRGTGGDPHK